jgi:chromosome segregation ATPase
MDDDATHPASEAIEEVKRALHELRDICAPYQKRLAKETERLTGAMEKASQAADRLTNQLDTLASDVQCLETGLGEVCHGTRSRLTRLDGLFEKRLASEHAELEQRVAAMATDLRREIDGVRDHLHDGLVGLGATAQAVVTRLARMRMEYEEGNAPLLGDRVAPAGHRGERKPDGKNRTRQRRQ